MRKNYSYHLVFIVLMLGFCLQLTFVKAQVVRSQTIWKTGEGAYKGYRIPALVVSVKETVLAFAEGRNDGGDSGDIDMVVKRSTDNGKTWSEEIVIWNDELNTCGNPCPVVDEETGRIWLWMTWNYGKDDESEIIYKKSEFPRKPFLCYSDDDGLSWSKLTDMSAGCKNPSWGWYATGPGFGIQQKSGKYKGRLIIPANHSYDDPNGNVRKGPYSYGAHVIISDDHGKTWRMSESITPGCNESQVTELSDGTLLMNMRSYNDKYSRAISVSSDGGETWSPVEHDFQLTESRCQASILNYGDYKGKSYYLFSNPAVPVGRTHMTIKISNNDCADWQIGKLIDACPSAYSCLVKLPNGDIGILYEAGEKKPYESIILVRLPIRSLLKCANDYLITR
ncbi:MAG: glycosyl hydrolase [Bacteroidetes bacterium GWF2_42_66]|nr:MAG: glycosyl hydrolase [Bacteroidetes bacterium GWA2_42_15]OFX96370.1 MAG: glycosyl hydrolase [Bacteroidetes bacterium GWE2_42_39]OFY46409.1 MAG: glycosyl hydrolase [Bacteroidetes bacterium GWF2_42_66]HAZ03726.1 exo-alpha-sialidase [Marinilabiliales bacterium]HBL78204.1 exo-alpha-sialidase [Prolixibacteraceae bacterium]